MRGSDCEDMRFSRSIGASTDRGRGGRGLVPFAGVVEAVAMLAVLLL